VRQWYRKHYVGFWIASAFLYGYVFTKSAFVISKSGGNWFDYTAFFAAPFAALNSGAKIKQRHKEDMQVFESTRNANYRQG